MQKFFCDNCGTKVKKDALRCPKCGRYFRSVKCPECGFSGSPGLFNDGCPSCGYAAEKIGSEFPGEQDFLPESSGRKFSDLFYKRIIPILIAVFIGLLILLLKIGI